ncbi:MAG: DMT family transporter [Pseudomonadota bacterium]
MQKIQPFLSAIRNAPSTVVVHAVMLGATMLVATSFPVVSAITGSLESSVLTFVRFAIATLLFAPFVAWRYGLGRPSLRDLARYSMLSLLLVTFFWCMFAALKLTNPLNTAAIFALGPAITAFVAAILLREALPVMARIALPLGAAGAILVIFRGDPASLIAMELGVGDLTFLLGTLALSIYSTLVKRLHRGEPMAQMTFWTLATGTMWLLLLSMPRVVETDWQTVPAGVFAGIAYLSVFTTILTFFAFQWSTTQIGPTRVAAYTLLNPALVLVLGLSLGEDWPPLSTWLGVALTFIATTYLQSPKMARSKTVAAA